MKNLNESIKIYKQELAKGNVQIAYTTLVKYMMSLSTLFSNKFSKEYTIGGLFQGYMDYTYFYYTNDFLKERKLKLGLVLNHKDMRFEIWLLGQTKPIQEKYWQLFKSTRWCKGVTEKPTYSVFETVIIDTPDFNDFEKLTTKIELSLSKVSKEIISDIKKLS